MNNKAPAISPTKNFFAGGFGGLCLVLAGHPFDTMKVRLQTMSKNSSANGFSGTLDCFQKTLKNEGIRGFYKGMATPVMTQAPRFALGFFGYSTGKKLIAAEQSTPLTQGQLFFAGSMSGGICSIIITPVERIKCLLQVQLGQAQGSPIQYKGPIDCAVKLYKTGGIQSLYRGFGATMFRAVPQSGLYYSTYDTLKKALTPKESTTPTQLSLWRTILAGGLTGVINWVFILPIDVIKSRVQTAPDGMYKRGVRDAVAHLLKEEGPRGFFKGIVPVFLRAFPANAACFMGVEVIMNFLNWAAPDM